MEIIRTKNSGVFAGTITEETATYCVLKDSRRLWYWSGAASLSQLAMEGVKNPEQCKFACVVPSCRVFEVIEIIPLTSEAEENIGKVKEWKV